MRSHSVLVPFVAVLLTLATVPIAGIGRFDQGGSPSAPPRNPSDAEIRQAIIAIERADGYLAILDATLRYEDILRSTRMVALADQLLQNQSLDANQRGLLMLERQLALDCRQRGATAAARLLSVRFLAGNALAADTPQQFAGVLEKFSPLAKDMTAQLVREALDTPGNSWPKAIFPLMEQLARDWPVRGALAAATRMAEAAQVTDTQTTGPTRGPGVAGHWRFTSIVFGSARDEHLVLNPDGTAEAWNATASGREPSTRGRWRIEGTTMNIDWADGRQWSQPFTFHEGELILPNISGRRKNWESIR